MYRNLLITGGSLGFAMFFTSLVQAQGPAGEGPAIKVRTPQSQIRNGTLTFDEIRTRGMLMFSTPFNKLDGYGDGPLDPLEPTQPGHRPTLQDNGTFLRVNGLDAQTCMECHSVGSNATVPFTFSVGGVGGSNNNAIFQPTEIDVDDSLANGFAFFNGRYINPPFLFGSGGVELLGKEMTRDLRGRRLQAINNPDTDIALTTHGVDFGTIRFDSATGTLDTSNAEGIDDDLVVRPFGRKGEFATVRGFDVGALQFHFGMQPVEEVGLGVDDDGDGVANEVLVGELSALHIFNTNLERPEVRDPSPTFGQGLALFQGIGCAGCHIPSLQTRGTVLRYTFPEVDTRPFAHTFYTANLAAGPAGFDVTPQGGLDVPLFSDLKRHDMGPGLSESFGHHLDSEFITARLWGVADTAPYLHDGRATTLTEAILAHGGEAQAPRDNFAALADPDKVILLDFLRSLRTPQFPAADIVDNY